MKVINTDDYEIMPSVQIIENNELKQDFLKFLENWFVYLDCYAPFEYRSKPRSSGQIIHKKSCER